MQLSNYDAALLDSWEFTLMRTAASISLTKAQYEKIESRYTTLQAILSTTNEPLLKDAHIFIQGSIGLRTAIRPVSGAPADMGTVDADAIVLLSSANGASAEQVLLAIQRRFKEGVRVDAPIAPLRRGIRILYADENPGFHMDVTPARGIEHQSDAQGFGKLMVPDRVTGWKNSSPRSYAKWLQDVSDQKIMLVSRADLTLKGQITLDHASQEPLADYDDYLEHNPLRATIKLLKRHRDLWAIANKKEKIRPISAIITTLAAKSYEKVAARSAARPLRPLEAILSIVEGMRHEISQTANGYEVLNPKDSGENFAEKWNRSGVEGPAYATAFTHWHTAVLKDLLIGLNDHGHAINFQEEFNKLFGIPKAEITDILNGLDGHAQLPGRKVGTTRNSLTFTQFAGASAATGSSQANVRPVDRLG